MSLTMREEIRKVDTECTVLVIPSTISKIN